MSWLRSALLVYAAAALVGAYFVFKADHGLLAGIYLAVNGLVVGLGVIFERGRYRPKAFGDDDWEITDEKFQDPATGKWTGVRYNRKTGERDYFELGE